MSYKLLGRVVVSRWACRCERCGHDWESSGKVLPRSCGRCKQVNWNTPGKLKPGRPAAQKGTR